MNNNMNDMSKINNGQPHPNMRMVQPVQVSQLVQQYEEAVAASIAAPPNSEAQTQLVNKAQRIKALLLQYQRQGMIQKQQQQQQQQPQQVQQQPSQPEQSGMLNGQRLPQNLTLQQQEMLIQRQNALKQQQQQLQSNALQQGGQIPNQGPVNMPNQGQMLPNGQRQLTPQQIALMKQRNLMNLQNLTPQKHEQLKQNYLSIQQRLLDVQKKQEEYNNNLVQKTLSEENRNTIQQELQKLAQHKKQLATALFKLKQTLGAIEMYQKSQLQKNENNTANGVSPGTPTNPNVNTNSLPNAMAGNVINAGGMNSDSGSSINNSAMPSPQLQNTPPQAGMAPQGFNMAQAISQAQTLKIHLNKLQPAIQNLQKVLQNVQQQQQQVNPEVLKARTVQLQQLRMQFEQKFQAYQNLTSRIKNHQQLLMAQNAAVAGGPSSNVGLSPVPASQMLPNQMVNDNQQVSNLD